MLFFFIKTGTSANDVHFQAFLLEGLHRWNKDREAQIVTAARTAPSSYNSKLMSVVNELSDTVLGKRLHMDYRQPRAYTGS